MGWFDRSFTIREIEQFPSEHWTQPNAYMDDYLFSRRHRIDELSAKTLIAMPAGLDSFARRIHAGRTSS